MADPQRYQDSRDSLISLFIDSVVDYAMFVLDPTAGSAASSWRPSATTCRRRVPAAAARGPRGARGRRRRGGARFCISLPATQTPRDTGTGGV